MMIKLLYVHYGDNWLRGSEICLLNLLKSLDKQRFTPVLWTNNPQLHQQVQQLGMTSELSEFGVLLGWKGQRATLPQFCAQIDQAKALIDKHNIQLIHVNSGAPCQWMWWAAKRCRVPMLTQLHSDYTLRDRLRLCLHLSPHLVTVSEAISDRLRREGYPSQHHSVVHNGIDTDALLAQPRQCVRTRLGLAPDSKIIASVGSLIRRKGMDRLIEMLADLQRDYVHLVIIGDGPEKRALQQKAAELNISHQVHLVGEQKEVCGWLRGGVDLFVSGARDEAFGLVLAEAALAGVPVIAPAVGGIPEVLQHQHSALLYNSHHPQQLMQCTERLLDDRALADRLRHQAHQRAITRFSLHANTGKLTRLYEELHEKTNNGHNPAWYDCLRPLKNLSICHS